MGRSQKTSSVGVVFTVTAVWVSFCVRGSRVRSGILTPEVQPQSRGCGSAMGMVCRTSSSSCSARCRWISIQQGVSLMLCRG